ncbi:hypothetical protein LCGC14_2139550 [marine sediment metagenome]|uniref:Uncharacterized protein n=1 Tax=marine sediment metagenome TaxID=412755 RepID=A0A0F9EL26_9ZZZZ
MQKVIVKFDRYTKIIMAIVVVLLALWLVKPYIESMIARPEQPKTDFQDLIKDIF